MGRPTKNLSGRRFGMLSVVRSDGIRGKNSAWLCRCDCGAEKSILASNLNRIGKDSCGCNTGKKVAKAHTTHGMTNTSEFKIWVSMNRRCTDPKTINYADYGGRGISVCERWRTSFENFYADIGPRPSRDHSVDRYPNSDGNYEPGNVRWATRCQQQRNRRGNSICTINGESRCVAEWSEISGINALTIHTRLARGWSPEAAVFEAPKIIRKGGVSSRH